MQISGSKLRRSGWRRRRYDSASISRSSPPGCRFGAAEGRADSESDPWVLATAVRCAWAIAVEQCQNRRAAVAQPQNQGAVLQAVLLFAPVFLTRARRAAPAHKHGR